MGLNIWARVYWIAWGTSRSVRSVMRNWTSPASWSLSPKTSSSSSFSLGGGAFRRGREVKEVLRLKRGAGFLGFLMRLEGAAKA